MRPPLKFKNRLGPTHFRLLRKFIGMLIWKRTDSSTYPPLKHAVIEITLILHLWYIQEDRVCYSGGWILVCFAHQPRDVTLPWKQCLKRSSDNFESCQMATDMWGYNWGWDSVQFLIVGYLISNVQNLASFVVLLVIIWTCNKPEFKVGGHDAHMTPHKIHNIMLCLLVPCLCPGID